MQCLKSSEIDMSDSPIVGPEQMPEILDEFLSRDEIRSREFWAHFENRRATHKIPMPDLYDCIRNVVCYDEHNSIEARHLETLVAVEDRALFGDVVRFVFEDFLNEPASPLTLQQFQAQLTRRLEQLGF